MSSEAEDYWGSVANNSSQRPRIMLAATSDKKKKAKKRNKRVVLPISQLKASVCLKKNFGKKLSERDQKRVKKLKGDLIGFARAQRDAEKKLQQLAGEKKAKKKAKKSKKKEASRAAKNAQLVAGIVAGLQASKGKKTGKKGGACASGEYPAPQFAFPYGLPPLPTSRTNPSLMSSSGQYDADFMTGLQIAAGLV